MSATAPCYVAFLYAFVFIAVVFSAVALHALALMQLLLLCLYASKCRCLYNVARASIPPRK